LLTKGGKQSQHVRLGIRVVSAASGATPVLQYIYSLLNIDEQ
jgi:hypothetical protein